MGDTGHPFGGRSDGSSSSSSSSAHRQSDGDGRDRFYDRAARPSLAERWRGAIATERTGT
jgi:hypothetical protein